MASVSFQVARTGLSEGGTSNVTEGTAAPTTGNNVEVRVDMAANWTKLEIEEALDRIVRFFLDATVSTSIPL
jgi:hypothetical protein